LELDRSTLADWGGGANALLDPLLGALEDYVMAARKLHADDTPIPVLAPGTGKTKSGRLWAYLRDDRPAGSTDPPAVLFRYSPDRKGSGLVRICSTFAASCRPMPTEDSTACTIASTSH